MVFVMRKQWFAVQVYTGREKWVASFLAECGFSQLLLLHREQRQWSDRLKTIDTPMFPGYVFCHFDPQQRVKVLSGQGVLRIVGYGRTPTPVDDEEIAALQVIKHAACPVEKWPYLHEGELVRIEGGSLDGLTGRFAHNKTGCRVVVSVSILQRSVAVEIDRSRLHSCR